MSEIQLTNLIFAFLGKYPRCSEKCINLNKSYPIDLKIKIAINVSILIRNLENGKYNKHFGNPNPNKTIPSVIIDIFATNYIDNFCVVADGVYEAIGKYEPFPKINYLLPDIFAESSIKQTIKKYTN